MGSTARKGAGGFQYPAGDANVRPSNASSFARWPAVHGVACTSSDELDHGDARDRAYVFRTRGAGERVLERRTAAPERRDARVREERLVVEARPHHARRDLHGHVAERERAGQRVGGLADRTRSTAAARAPSTWYRRCCSRDRARRSHRIAAARRRGNERSEAIRLRSPRSYSVSTQRSWIVGDTPLPSNAFSSTFASSPLRAIGSRMSVSP